VTHPEKVLCGAAADASGLLGANAARRAVAGYKPLNSWEFARLIMGHSDIAQRSGTLNLCSAGVARNRWH
jgi:hypothetical protein